MKYEKLMRQMVEHHKGRERKKGRKEGISWWQLSLIGIGSIIGAGFFLGTGLAISITGPSVLIAYLIAGFIGYLTFIALTEMTVNDPDKGSFRSYARKAFGESMGFISGWMYWIAGVLTMSSEIAALSLLTQYWFPDVSLWIFAIAYSSFGVGINLLGVKDFGTIESFFAIVKIVTLVLFVFFGVFFILGYFSPKEGVTGIDAIVLSQTDWLPNGLKGLWSSMIFALFPFCGVAMIGIASNELKEKESIPKAVNILVMTLIFIYTVTLFIVLKMVSWTKLSEQESPFVTALSTFNMPYVSSIFNFVIVSAAFSTFVAALFAITNVICSLAEDGEAPKVLIKKNKRGVAVKALLLSTIGLGVTVVLSYLLPKTIYEYMTASAGVLMILNWCIILASQIKNRKKYDEGNGGSKTKKKYKMMLYPYSSYFGIGLVIFSVSGGTLRHNQRMGLLVGVVIIAILVIVYYMFRDKMNKK